MNEEEKQELNTELYNISVRKTEVESLINALETRKDLLVRAEIELGMKLKQAEETKKNNSPVSPASQLHAKKD